MRQFQGARKYATPLSRLASIEQGPSETLKAYVKRFNKELATIHNPQENGVLMVAISRVRPKTPFWDKLQKDECKTLQEFCRRADKIMRLETAREVALTKRSTLAKASREIAPTRKTQSAENNRDNKKRKNGDRRRSPDAHQKKQRARIRGSSDPLRVNTTTLPT